MFWSIEKHMGLILFSFFFFSWLLTFYLCFFLVFFFFEIVRSPWREWVVSSIIHCCVFAVIFRPFHSFTYPIVLNLKFPLTFGYLHWTNTLPNHHFIGKILQVQSALREGVLIAISPVCFHDNSILGSKNS